MRIHIKPQMIAIVIVFIVIFMSSSCVHIFENAMNEEYRIEDLGPGRYTIHCPSNRFATLSVDDSGLLIFTYKTTESSECIKLMCDGKRTSTGQVILTETNRVVHVTSYDGHKWEAKSVTFIKQEKSGWTEDSPGRSVIAVSSNKYGLSEQSKTNLTTTDVIKRRDVPNS